MAKDISVKLRNEVIYSIYVRNHTEEGTFKSVEKDLLRIKNLGTDIVWFMPIHSIGDLNKKEVLVKGGVICTDGFPIIIKNNIC